MRPDSGSSFSLTYEVTAGDLQEIYALSPDLQRRRTRAKLTLAGWAVLAAAETAAVAMLGLGRPTAFLFALAIVSWIALLATARGLWLLSPARAARQLLRSRPGLAGPHRGEAGPAGVTCLTPSGTSAFLSWQALARLRETGHAFHLLDRAGTCRGTLPKRGLASPDQVPQLREFLTSAIAGRPAAASPRGPAGGPLP